MANQDYLYNHTSGGSPVERISPQPPSGESPVERISLRPPSWDRCRELFSPFAWMGARPFWGVGESTFLVQCTVVRRNSEETNSKHSGNTGTATHDASRLEPMTLPVPIARTSWDASCLPVHSPGPTPPRLGFQDQHFCLHDPRRLGLEDGSAFRARGSAFRVTGSVLGLRYRTHV